MAMDFPSDPVLGQEYQAPGGPLYAWDGEAWVTGPSGPVPASTPSRRPNFGLASVDAADPGAHQLRLRLPALPRVSDGTMVTFVTPVSSGEGSGGADARLSAAPPTLDVNGSGRFPLMTNRGDIVGADDIRAGVPCAVVLYHGAWYLLGGSSHA